MFSWIPSLPVSTWFVVVGVCVGVIAWAGVLITALTLPGLWLSILGAVMAQWWSISMWGGYGGQAIRPGGAQMFSWWTLGACVAIGVIAEIVEMVASSYGAAKAGGSKLAGIASIGGAIVGAILGTMLIPVPVLGTILGAAVGAGVLAMGTEKGIKRKNWGDSTRVGASAAAGRLVATVIKVALSAIIALAITLDVCI